MSPNDNQMMPDQPSWMRTDDGAHDQTLEENWLFRLRKERFQSRRSARATIST